MANEILTACIEEFLATWEETGVRMMTNQNAELRMLGPYPTRGMYNEEWEWEYASDEYERKKEEIMSAFIRRYETLRIVQMSLYGVTEEDLLRYHEAQNAIEDAKWLKTIEEVAEG